MAKIPIILEAGRADGKLVTSNSIFDENKSMFQSELNDIQDTLNSDNPNKPLSANQGKVLKELLDSKVIEAGAVPIDEEPIEGNTTHIISSDAVYKNSQADKIRHLSSILGTKTVKDNLNILENIIGINLIWEEGYYLTPSGVKIPHISWKITDYIPLNNILYNIAYKVQLFKNTAICLYNSNKTFITSYYPNSDTVITIKDIIDISQHPEAAYIRFTTAILDNASFAYKILGTDIIANESITKNKLAKDAIVNVTKNEKTTSIKIGTNDVIDVLNGEYAAQIDSYSGIQKQGTLSKTVPMYITITKECKSGESLFVKASSDTATINGGLFIFQDNNNTNITVQLNAEFKKITLPKNSSNIQLYCYQNNVSTEGNCIFEITSSLAPEVNNNTKNITKILNDVLTLNQNLNLAYSNTSRKYNIYKGFINQDGDVTDNDKIYHTDYIPIKLNQSLIYNNTIRSIDSSVNMCFYDKDKNKISSYLQADAGLGVKTITITNSKIEYVRLSFYISSIHLFFVYIDNYLIIQSINEKCNSIASINYTWLSTKGYIALNGNFIPFESSWVSTDYIEINISPVINNIICDTYIFKNTAICLYDSDKKFIKYYSNDSDLIKREIITIDLQNYPNAKYIRCCTQNPDLFDLYKVLQQSYIVNLSEKNIADKAISIKKISFTVHDSSSNYINRNNLKQGYYINDKGEEIPSTSEYYITDKIFLIPETYYYWDSLYTGYYAFYDQNDNVIEAYGAGSYLSNSFKFPTNAYYAKFTMNTPNANKNCWIHTINKKPIDYKEIINPEYIQIPNNSVSEETIIDNSISENKIQNNSISSSKIKNKTITLENLSFSKHDDNTNYINPNTWIPNTYINNGIETKYNGFYSTGPVYLKQNIDYYWDFLYSGYYAFYAENGTILEYHNINDPAPNPFRLCEGATYARFTIVDPSSKDKSWIFTSNNKPNLYKETIDKSVIPIDIEEKTFCDYDGNEISAFAKCVCIGDSLTAGTMNYKREGQSDGYVSYDKCSFPRNLERLTGITVSNLGIGGATSFEWYKTNKNKPFFVVPEKGRVEDYVFDMAIIQMGVNDAIRNMSRFGKAWSTPEDTAELEDPTANSYDGFINIINKLKTECKHIKIFISTIIPAKSYSSPQYIEICQNIRDFVTELNDPDVILIDIQTLGHTKDYDAYNCGHLSAFGYWRLAQDYKNVISYYMNTHKNEFRTIQFVGTDYTY